MNFNGIWETLDKNISFHFSGNTYLYNKGRQEPYFHGEFILLADPIIKLKFSTSPTTLIGACPKVS